MKLLLMCLIVLTACNDEGSPAPDFVDRKVRSIDTGATAVEKLDSLFKVGDTVYNSAGTAKWVVIE